MQWKGGTDKPFLKLLTFHAGLSFDGVAQPCEMVAIDGDHVEAAGRHTGKAQQIHLGGAHQAADLGGGDAGGGAAMFAGGTLAHFDEDEGVAVLHDQIDLAALAGEIGLDE